MSVRKDKKKMFNQVKDILIHHESCRDSDIKLSYVIYSKVDRDFAEGSIVSFFSKLEMRSLPSFSTISRARRLVQERHPELRGNKYKGRQKGRSTNSLFTGANGIKNKFSYSTKMPPMQPLMEWAKRKNIRFRDDKGRFKKGDYRTIGFWVQKRIFAQGLKPTLFFSKAFRKEFKKLPSEILEAFKIDVERQLILGIKQ